MLLTLWHYSVPVILEHIYEDLKTDSLEGSSSLLEKISCVMYQV